MQEAGQPGREGVMVNTVDGDRAQAAPKRLQEGNKELPIHCLIQYAENSELPVCIIMDSGATGISEVILPISLPPIDKGETCFIILQDSRNHTLSYLSLHHNLCW